MTMHALAAGQAAVVGSFLLLAGSLKVLGRPGAEHDTPTVAERWLGPGRERIATGALAGVEIALGTLLLLNVLATFASVAAAAMLAGGALVLAIARRTTPEASCGCMGAASDEPIGWATIARAGGLGLVALGPALVGGASWTDALHSVPALLAMAGELALLALVSPELPRLPERAEWTRSRTLRRAVRAVRRTDAYRGRREQLRSRRPTDAWSEPERDIVLFDLAEQTATGETWLAFAVERSTGSVAQMGELSLTPTVRGWEASTRAIDAAPLAVSAGAGAP